MIHSIRTYRTTQDERKNRFFLKIISIITASFMLAAPCLNAGLADWISNNVPKSWQVSQEYRDEVKYIQDKTGKPVPIIFINSTFGGNDDARAAAFNIGIGSLRFAIMYINQESLKKYGSPACNTRVLAHETVHIDQNHGGKASTAYLAASAALLTSYASSASSQMSPSETDLSVAFVAKSAVAFYIGSYIGSSYVGPYFRKLLSQIGSYQKDEYEAEKGSFEKLKKLGYRKALEAEHKHYQSLLYRVSQDERIHGIDYPTLGEYAAWSKEAYEECAIGIDPSVRSDTLSLMRNGGLDEPKSILLPANIPPAWKAILEKKS